MLSFSTLLNPKFDNHININKLQHLIYRNFAAKFEFGFLQLYLEPAVRKPPLDEALLDVGHDVVLEDGLLPLDLLDQIPISASSGKAS